jgi:3-oxoacyl-[acyl-carrier protein] reductase
VFDGPGYPDDVANTVLFLVSNDSRFITGEIINVDGGMPGKL